MVEGIYAPDNVMSGAKGTKVVTTSFSGQCRGFVPNEDTTISALASKSIANGVETANSDVLAAHIEGGVATTLKAGIPVFCQQHSFTAITVASGTITVIL